jgi:hypothetical protein
MHYGNQSVYMHGGAALQVAGSTTIVSCSTECLLCSGVLAALGCSIASYLCCTVQWPGSVGSGVVDSRCRALHRFAAIRECSQCGRFASLCVGVHGPPACSKCDSRRVRVAQRASCSGQQSSVALPEQYRSSRAVSPFQCIQLCSLGASSRV